MNNKYIYILFLSISFFLILKCDKGKHPQFGIKNITVTADKDYIGVIHSSAINFANPVPYNTKEVIIKELELDKEITSNKKIGDKLKVDTTNIIIVTSIDGTTRHYYAYIYSKKE